MTDDEGEETLAQDDEVSIRELRNYWLQRLNEFEKVEYPVFYAKGYSKNTALTAVMIDELAEALTIASAIRGKK